jgi:hypothetical protein
MDNPYSCGRQEHVSRQVLPLYAVLPRRLQRGRRTEAMHRKPIIPAPLRHDRPVLHHDRSKSLQPPNLFVFLFNIPKKTYLIKRLFKRSKNI